MPPQQKNDRNIEVAAVSVDGGRAQKREQHCGVGVHNPAWVETKVAALQVFESKVTHNDPHPKLPKAFKDQKTVQYLVDGLKGYTARKTEENEKVKEKNSLHIKRVKAESDYRPKVISKSVVASVDKAESFGNLIFHKTYEHQLQTAKRKAFIGDGDHKIWTIFEDNFKADGWIPVLDFVHAVEYAFEAAKLTTETTAQCWVKYIEFATHIWQGRVLTVIRRLDKFITENGSQKSKALQERIERIKKISAYFKNNCTKMDYSSYRKKGLPVSSCHVESLIKQLNIRVKSSDKFWNQSSLKGILKLKASLLSDDNSWQSFWRLRYERQYNSKRKYFRKAA